MKNIILENEKNTLIEHKGFTKFKGCQCFKDCTCHEDFTPEFYNYFTVKRKIKKTTYHDNLKEAMIRWDFVNTL